MLSRHIPKNISASWSCWSLSLITCSSDKSVIPFFTSACLKILKSITPNLDVVTTKKDGYKLVKFDRLLFRICRICRSGNLLNAKSVYQITNSTHSFHTRIVSLSYCGYFNPRGDSSPHKLTIFSKTA